MNEPKNKRVGGFEAYYERPERAAKRIIREAEERKEGYLVSPIDMVALRAVLKDKPEGAEIVIHAPPPNVIGSASAQAFQPMCAKCGEKITGNVCGFSLQPGWYHPACVDFGEQP